LSKNQDPLHISNEMAAFDRKDRAYYDKFTDEQRKKFSTYLMLRYGASVTGDITLQSYYLMATNQRVNKHFFDLNRHPKLQWLMCTSVSPDMGNKYHYWLPAKKKVGASTNKLIKFVREIWPNLKEDELEMIITLNDKKELKQLAKEHGWNDKQIKTDL
jgi:hypothetical protein